MQFLFQPANVNNIYEERVAIILGITTLTLAIFTFASCRTCLAWLNRIGIKPLENKGYQAFYKYHSYYWWGFWFILTIHLLTAIMHIGITNTATDPDSYLHWYSLFSGITGFSIVLVVLSSCRSFTHTLKFLTNKNPLSSKAYQGFYRYHTYYWLFFLAVIVAHFTFGYVHSGVWPG